jgi:hypothetical protein
MENQAQPQPTGAQPSAPKGTADSMPIGVAEATALHDAMEIIEDVAAHLGHVDKAQAEPAAALVDVASAPVAPGADGTAGVTEPVAGSGDPAPTAEPSLADRVAALEAQMADTQVKMKHHGITGPV